MSEKVTVIKEAKRLKYSIILKELDENKNHLCYDCNIVLPNLQFGESNPFIIGIHDDQSKLFPIQDIWCIDQNFGIENDFELAQSIIRQKHAQTIQHNDPSVR